MRQRNIKKYLIGFGKYRLELRENTDLTVKNHLTGIKSFYQTFDLRFQTCHEYGRRHIR